MRGAVLSGMVLAFVIAGCSASSPRDRQSGAVAVQPEPEPEPQPQPQPEPQPEPQASWPGADLADCDRSQCGRRLIGMPNWVCVDGTRGGPVCKQRADGRCAWVVVRCPHAKPGAVFAQPPGPADDDAEEAPVVVDAPDSEPDDAPQPPPPPKRCGDLPDDDTLKTWPVVVISPPACGPRPPPQPVSIKKLDDGTFIGEDRRRGCVRARYGRCKRTKCLPPDTRIATPAGEIAIRELEVGMEVWTRDAAGAKVVASIVATSSVDVAADHELVVIALADGRSVAASVGHPAATGEGVEELRAGRLYDGSEITRVETLRARAPRTFDILPAGVTGVYWADGIPLRSTLFSGAAD